MQVGALLVGMLAVALMGCTTPERIPSGVPHTATPSTAPKPAASTNDGDLNASKKAYGELGLMEKYQFRQKHPELKGKVY